jgi:hypothetical protein
MGPRPGRVATEVVVPRAVRALGLVTGMVVLLTIVNARPALAEAWVEIRLPNISERPEDPGLDRTPPYTLRWAREGTTSSGTDDCDPAPPYRRGMRAKSNLLTGVKGIAKRGPFWKEGSYTSSDGGNALAFFFHQNQCYDGGDEYGFTRKLNQENTTLYFYQCASCNTGSEEYTRKAVWSSAESDLIYVISVQADGDFDIKVYEVEPGGGLELLHSEVVTKASWLLNLYGADGYITANAHTGSASSPDSYEGSYNHVESIKYLP